MLWRMMAVSFLVIISLSSFADNAENKSIDISSAAEEGQSSGPTKDQQTNVLKPIVPSSNNPSPFAVPRTEKKIQPEVGSGVATADLLSVVSGLLLVVVLIVAVAWLMRRLGGMPTVGGQSMRVLGALSVGTREKIILVDVAGKQLLLGVAPGRVNCLESFADPVIDTSTHNNSEFSQTIKNLLKDRSGSVSDSN